MFYKADRTIQIRGRLLFSINSPGTCKRIKVDLYITSAQIIKSKRIIDLNVRVKL